MQVLGLFLPLCLNFLKTLLLPPCFSTKPPGPWYGPLMELCRKWNSCFFELKSVFSTSSLVPIMNWCGMFSYIRQPKHDFCKTQSTRQVQIQSVHILSCRATKGVDSNVINTYYNELKCVLWIQNSTMFIPIQLVAIKFSILITLEVHANDETFKQRSGQQFLSNWD